MPIASLAVKKWQQLLRNFGIHASEVRVRSHWPWYWYVVAGLLLVLCCFLLVLAMDHFVRNDGESPNERALRGRVQQLEKEILHLQQSKSSDSNDLLIATSTQKNLLEKLRYLERQNAALKEDISFYEKVGVKGWVETGLRIERARIVKDLSSPNVYRYRLLVAYKGSGQNKVFKGQIRFDLEGMNGAAPVKLSLPLAKDSNLSDYQVNVSNIESKEGNIEIPEGMEIKKAEVVILQGETVKTKQTVQIGD